MFLATTMGAGTITLDQILVVMERAGNEVELSVIVGKRLAVKEVKDVIGCVGVRIRSDVTFVRGEGSANKIEREARGGGLGGGAMSGEGHVSTVRLKMGVERLFFIRVKWEL
ncbi:hypothetical protein ACFX13_025250 [Malus domestica]